MTRNRRRAARPGGRRLNANIQPYDRWIPARHRPPCSRKRPRSRTAGTRGQLPADEPYLDLAQYEQLIALGTADADARDCPVDDVTARRLAIWMAARPQHPVLARDWSALPVPARSAPSCRPSCASMPAPAPTSIISRRPGSTATPSAAARG